MNKRLTDTVATFRDWLYLPEPDPFLAVVATVVAHRLPGDPVWLALVGSPGCGKTELLNTVAGLDDVYPASTLTEGALLSGVPKREARNAKGGLLREIGDSGILLAKDFGSVLSMNRDTRAAVLAALREIYDGKWTRHVGTDGGKTLEWAGKLGFLAGVTPAIDSHHGVIGSMGERLVFYRMTVDDEERLATDALTHLGREQEMRAAIARATRLLLDDVDLHRPAVSLSDEERERLIALATFAVRCRSAVDRHAYTREIERVDEPEAPGRLVLVLDRLLDALDRIGADRDEAWRVVTRTALDSMPTTRRAVVDVLLREPRRWTVNDFADEVGAYAPTTIRRILQDLAAHGVTESRVVGEHATVLWSASPWARDRWTTAVPETSESLYLSYSERETKREGSLTAAPETSETSGAGGGTDARSGPRIF